MPPSTTTGSEDSHVEIVDTTYYHESQDDRQCKYSTDNHQADDRVHGLERIELLKTIQHLRIHHEITAQSRIAQIERRRERRVHEAGEQRSDATLQLAIACSIFLDSRCTCYRSIDVFDQGLCFADENSRFHIFSSVLFFCSMRSGMPLTSN